MTGADDCDVADKAFCPVLLGFRMTWTVVDGDRAVEFLIVD